MPEAALPFPLPVVPPPTPPPVVPPTAPETTLPSEPQLDDAAEPAEADDAELTGKDAPVDAPVEAEAPGNGGGGGGGGPGPEPDADEEDAPPANATAGIDADAALALDCSDSMPMLDLIEANGLPTFRSMLVGVRRRGLAPEMEPPALLVPTEEAIEQLLDVMNSTVARILADQHAAEVLADVVLAYHRGWFDGPAVQAAEGPFQGLSVFRPALPADAGGGNLTVANAVIGGRCSAPRVLAGPLRSCEGQDMYIIDKVMLPSGFC